MADGNKGMWAEPEYREDNPPGQIEYPNDIEMTRFEKAAEAMPDSSPAAETSKK